MPTQTPLHASLLTPAARDAAVRALPADTAALASAFDDDFLVRTLAVQATLLGARLREAEAAHERSVRAAGEEIGRLRAGGAAAPAAPGLDHDDLGRLLAAVVAGDRAATDLPAGALRDAAAAAAKTRRRCEDLAAEVARLRADLEAATKRAGGASASILRAFEAAAREGAVADDLPRDLRAAVQAVADLHRDRAAATGAAAAARDEALAQAEVARRERDAAARVQAEVARLQAERSAPGASPAEVEAAARDAATRVERDLSAQVRAAEAEVRRLKREVAAVRLVSDRHLQEARHRIGEVEAAQRTALDARAAATLIAEAAGVALDPSRPLADQVEALASAAAQRRIAPRAQAEASAVAPPAHEPEPPPMRDCNWSDLRPGDLAIDRFAARRLRATYEDVERGIAREPSDADRRVLALRVGDRVAWVRATGCTTTARRTRTRRRTRRRRRAASSAGRTRSAPS